MARYAMAKARKKLTDLVGRVAYGGERITIGRRNKDMAVLVSVDDARLLEELEDIIDVVDARKALAKGGKSIPWVKVKKELGL